MARPTKRAMPGDELPPHSIEAERAVLGALLLQPHIFDHIHRALPKDAFYDLRHQAIFQAMSQVKSENLDIDAITITSKLRLSGKLEECGGIVYLSELADSIASVQLVDTHITMLIEFATRRRLLRLAINMIKNVQDQETREVLDTIQSELTHCVQSVTSTKPRHIKEVAIAAVEEIETDYNRKTLTIGVPTGFAEFDSMTGGLHRSELVIIAARPGIGKTSLALNIAEYAGVVGKMAVGFLSLEMTAQSLGKRLLSAISGVNLREVVSRENQEDNINALTKALTKLIKANIHIDDCPNLTIGQLCSKTKIMHAEHRLDLVIVDYLQLLHSDIRMERRYLEIGDITKRLKGLAKSLDIPIIALSQLSRSSDEKTPTLSSLSESSSIEQDADTVCLLYHDDKRSKGHMTLHIAKQRNGPVGKVKLWFNPSCTRFEDPPLIDPSDIPAKKKQKPYTAADLWQ